MNRWITPATSELKNPKAGNEPDKGDPLISPSRRGRIADRGCLSPPPAIPFSPVAPLIMREAGFN